MATSYTLCILICLIMLTSGQWTQHSEPLMPRASEQMAIGYYDQIIYLLYVSVVSVHCTFPPIYRVHCMYRGGTFSHWQVMSYNIEHNNFTTFDSNYLSSLGNNVGEYGYGGYYTQLNGMLYTIVEDGDYIHAYDLQLQPIPFQRIEPAIPITVGVSSCLASSEEPTPRLYVTGGVGHMNDVQILKLTTLSWRNNVPSMIYGRSSHGCIVVNDMLYAIGQVSAVERMNVTDIQSALWEVMGYLSENELVEFGQVVEADGVIYIIGGCCPRNSVYTIDTVTGNIELQADALPIAVLGTAAVKVGVTIYAFGGWSGCDECTEDHWMTYELLSLVMSVHETKS